MGKPVILDKGLTAEKHDKSFKMFGNKLGKDNNYSKILFFDQEVDIISLRFYRDTSELNVVKHLEENLHSG